MLFGPVYPSRFHLPVSLGSTVVTRFPATMETLTPAPLPSGTGAGLFAYPMMPSDPSHSNHPPAASSPPLSWDLRAGHVPAGTDFAFTPQARPSVWPYRVHLHWYDGLGRVFPFRLLPTPPPGDAVAFRFRALHASPRLGLSPVVIIASQTHGAPSIARHFNEASRRAERCPALHGRA